MTIYIPEMDVLIVSKWEFNAMVEKGKFDSRKEEAMGIIKESPEDSEVMIPLGKEISIDPERKLLWKQIEEED